MAAKKIRVQTGNKKKISIQADDSPELVAVFNPWQKAREAAGKAKEAVENKEQWRWGVVASCLIVLLLLIGGGVELERYWTRPDSPLSPDITSNLPFSPYIIPKNTTGYYTYNYRSTNAEGQAKILSFNIVTPNNTTITLSEYAEPAQFNSVNGYKAQFLSNVISQYATVQSKSGTIYLGRATGANDKQIAALISHGILVLMSPSQNMTNQQWTGLGDQLVIQKL